MTGMVQMGNRHGAGCGANPGALLRPHPALDRGCLLSNQGESSLIAPNKAKKIYGRVLTLFDVYQIGLANMLKLNPPAIQNRNVAGQPMLHLFT
jgi:hypothetical protein